MKNNQTLLISCLIVAVVFGGGGFYAGMQYTKSQTPSFAGRFAAGQNGGNARFQQNDSGNERLQGRGFGGGSAGEVVSKDDSSLTLKLTDGGSKIVYLSASTTVNKMTEGNLDDVAEGTNVMVVGSSNQDGSITASQIQLRPNLPGLPDGMPRP